MNRARSSVVLHEASGRLAATWNRTVEIWRDEVATRFANEFWKPIDQAVHQYLNAIERLEEALVEAERAVGEHF